MRYLMWGLVVAALSAAAVGLASLRPRLTPAERGRRLAERLGCFGCHGPGGIHGASNPGRSDHTVPEFGDDLMMYAKTRNDVAEWIDDGVTAARRRSVTWRTQRERGALKMPAFGSRLSPVQISDLAEFVLATAGEPEPRDSLARAGLARLGALGCAGCHGPGGLYARPNPGSLKNYIPSWDGDDFPELVRSREEFDQWVKRGISERFDHNWLARFFVRRAVIVMPRFEKHLQPGDLDLLWDYVRWLRAGGRTASSEIGGADSEP